ncbi:phosphoadenylyl-sulfate reductase [Alisedimentitalea sp. MJ-SS2]|uniref:phosphoadenylyl-sulfate reductase n=1 Tax=Aliisedimentitalea sp. MJ-SS2 TaxID=3049795 RepID=UPI0029087B66|nr:phosphoadenylyl-sulfate reductase [Alisedimentitalea sp. MJ-SS2]MDU8926701.1 phosphoadenylyl-sulfate reductase [Alisedimentitalea sp. MJ-SS2]
MLHLTDPTAPGGPRLLHPRSLSLLDAHFADRKAEDLLDYALSGALGRIALVSSFGAEAAVLLHMASRIDQDVPVLILDTHLLFAETLAYQSELAAHLGLGNLHILRAVTEQSDPDNSLHQTDPDACCALRKTAPLTRALTQFDGWITGRKRAQSGTRASLQAVERDPDAGKVRLNPLFDWSPAQVAAYFDAHDLPRHPLVARGFTSIGCAPCTTPTKPGEDPRAGRWRGRDKIECGIHFANGKAIRNTRQGNDQ